LDIKLHRHNRPAIALFDIETESHDQFLTQYRDQVEPALAVLLEMERRDETLYVLQQGIQNYNALLSSMRRSISSCDAGQCDSVLSDIVSLSRLINVIWK